MHTPNQFLEKTRSGLEHLFEAIDSYRKILVLTEQPVFSGTYSSEAEALQARNRWIVENTQEIETSLQSQRRYLAETFSLSILSGSVLALVEKFIEIYSHNHVVTADLGFELNPKKAKYCVGRLVNGIPLGLVLHAARNQHFHFESEQNHHPVLEVFNALSQRVSQSTGESYQDPAFLMNDFTRPILAANVLSLIGWTSATTCLDEMREILIAK
jgi:hypothetical protein